MPSIDNHTYRKDLRAKPFGFGVRPKGVGPSSIVIHTTNNPKPTTFAFESEYLYNSTLVSAHYTNGKAGEIAMIVPPELMAWHAGAALSAWKNERSIGIENVVSGGEHWTQAQHDSLTWLVRTLMTDYHISASMIETHRRVAVPGPNKRKHDPEAWTDEAFYDWRAGLTPLGPLPPTGHYRTIAETPVYQAQSAKGTQWGALPKSTDLTIDKTYPGGIGHDSLGRGFVWLEQLAGPL